VKDELIEQCNDAIHKANGGSRLVNNAPTVRYAIAQVIPRVDQVLRNGTLLGEPMEAVAAHDNPSDPRDRSGEPPPRRSTRRAMRRAGVERQRGSKIRRRGISIGRQWLQGAVNGARDALGHRMAPLAQRPGIFG
jgi:hypothetical protein